MQPMPPFMVVPETTSLVRTVWVSSANKTTVIIIWVIDFPILWFGDLCFRRTRAARVEWAAARHLHGCCLCIYSLYLTQSIQSIILRVLILRSIAVCRSQRCQLRNLSINHHYWLKIAPLTNDSSTKLQTHWHCRTHGYCCTNDEPPLKVFDHFICS